MEITHLKPDIRWLRQMQEVLFDTAWAKTAPDDLELYSMYRDLTENESDRQKIVSQNLRYDITVMPFVMLGQEFNKTVGHYHPLVPNTNLTFPEIYQVLEGEVIFLLQRVEQDKIKDILAIKAVQNDMVIVPPDYGHVMINASRQELKTANWVERNFKSIYEPVKEKRGFGYYATQDASGQITWVKNEHYSSVPALKFLEPNLWLDKFNIEKRNMYQLFETPKKLDFLKNPQKYQWQIEN